MRLEILRVYVYSEKNEIFSLEDNDRVAQYIFPLILDLISELS